MSRALASASDVFDGMESREDWLGFGYLGERRNARASVVSGEWPAEILTRVAECDEALLAVLGEDAERVFLWANSREGRKFADYAFGYSTAPAAEVVASWRSDWRRRGDWA